MKYLKYKLGDSIFFKDPTSSAIKRGVIAAITSISQYNKDKIITKYVCCVLDEKSQLIGFQNGDCLIDVDIVLSNSNIVLCEKDMYINNGSNFGRISTSLTNALQQFKREQK